MNDDQLANELRRRAGSAEVPNLLPAVRSAIDTRPQPVPASRWAPLAGLAGVAAVLVLLVVAAPRLAPGTSPSASAGLPDALPSTIRMIGNPEFAQMVRAGSLRGHTVVTRGEILPFDEPGRVLYGSLCSEGVLVQDEAPEYTCLVGRLAGTDPPLYIHSQYLAQIAGESDSESLAAPYVWRGIAAPVSGNLVVSIDAYDRITLLGGTPEDDWALVPSELAMRDPGLEPFATAYVVPAWLTGVVEPLPCAAPPPRVDVDGLPGRDCGELSWLGAHPLVTDGNGYSSEPGGVRVQSGAYSAYAPTPSVEGPVEPRAGLYVVASRVEGSGCADVPPCRAWEVIGRITLNGDDGPIGPIATPLAMPDVAPTDAVAPHVLACPPVSDSLGRATPTLVDGTGLVVECLAATAHGGPPLRNPEGNQSILEIEWSGDSCAAAATLSFTGTAGSYSLEITPAAGGCRLLHASYAVRLALSEPVPAADVQLTHGDPPDLGQGWWELAPHERPAGDSSELDLVVYERACANGVSPEGRVVGPEIEYSAEAVTILFWVSALPGGGDCPSAPGAPITVQLAEPLGDRQLVDGADGSPVTIARDAEFVALSSPRVDELAHERFEALAGPSACITIRFSDRFVPTQAELEAMAAELGPGGEGLVPVGANPPHAYLGEWLDAARAFGAIEAYGGRPKPWYALFRGLPITSGETNSSNILTLVALDPFPISGGRTIWYPGFHQATVADLDCAGPPTEPSTNPPPTPTTIACSGAPISPENGSASIEDHTNLIAGCTVVDGHVPGEAPITSTVDPAELVVPWTSYCGGSLPARLEFWRQDGNDGASAVVGDRPPFLLTLDTAAVYLGEVPEFPVVCADEGVDRAVHIRLHEPIHSSQVELLRVTYARGSDTAQVDEDGPTVMLSIRATKNVYSAGEPIEVSSAVLADTDVTLECGGHPFIALEQLDGPISFIPGPFIRACQSVELRGGEPLTLNFLPALWALASPHPLEPYILDGQLYLPPGTYRFFATSTFGMHAILKPLSRLEASVIVTVR